MTSTTKTDSTSPQALPTMVESDVYGMKMLTPRVSSSLVRNGAESAVNTRAPPSSGLPPRLPPASDSTPLSESSPSWRLKLQALQARYSDDGEEEQFLDAEEDAEMRSAVSTRRAGLEQDSARKALSLLRKDEGKRFGSTGKDVDVLKRLLQKKNGTGDGATSCENKMAESSSTFRVAEHTSPRNGGASIAVNGTSTLPSTSDANNCPPRMATTCSIGAGSTTSIPCSSSAELYAKRDREKMRAEAAAVYAAEAGFLGLGVDETRTSDESEEMDESKAELKQELFVARASADFARSENLRLRGELKKVSNEASECRGELEAEKVMHEADRLCWKATTDEALAASANESDDSSLLVELGRQKEELSLMKAEISHFLRREKTLEEELARAKTALDDKTQECEKKKDSIARIQADNVLESNDMQEELAELRRVNDEKTRQLEAQILSKESELQTLRDEADEREQTLEEKEQENLRLLVGQAQLRTEIQRLECEIITKYVPTEEAERRVAEAKEKLEERLNDTENALEVRTQALREELEEAKSYDKALREQLAVHKGELQAVVDAKKKMEEVLLEELHESSQKIADLKQREAEKGRELTAREEAAKEETKAQVRREMRDFTSELRSTFESDWEEEARTLNLKHEAHSRKLEQQLAGAKIDAAKARDEATNMRASLQLAESQLRTLSEASWEVEAVQKREAYRREELHLKCERYETQVAQLRSDLQKALAKAEDDHLMFRSAESCLQTELVQLRKKILKSELVKSCAAGGTTLGSRHSSLGRSRGSGYM
ncbi:unnamed protein product [Amoebophrya sp. A25]|nr:unnamed protein product [Amoebophrya sp. A25]|eukprot:GSA25T00001191001.1